MFQHYVTAPSNTALPISQSLFVAESRTVNLTIAWQNFSRLIKGNLILLQCRIAEDVGADQVWELIFSIDEEAVTSCLAVIDNLFKEKQFKQV